MRNALKLAMFAVLITSQLTSCSGLQTRTLPREDSAALKVQQGNEVVMFAMNLMGSGYRFGGSNPDSGLDCSGMVSFIYQQVLGIKLSHNAAQIAHEGKAIKVSELLPGDLVFFNTTGQSYSHVGIYIGDDRFIHAPKQNGKISISSLKDKYFMSRLDAARTYF